MTPLTFLLCCIRSDVKFYRRGYTLIEQTVISLLKRLTPCFAVVGRRGIQWCKLTLAAQCSRLNLTADVIFFVIF